MGDVIDLATILVAVAMITIGSFTLGRFSSRVASPTSRSMLLAIGISMPLLVIGGLSAFVPPAREMTYNLVPFGVAILLLPVSTVLTLWGKGATRS
jgi:hypothetical protein